MATTKATTKARSTSTTKALENTKTWPDSTGRDIKLGDKVKLGGKVIGTAAYRCTHGKDWKEKKVRRPMIGVALADTGAAQSAGAVNGRAVKRRAFDSTDLTVVTK